MEHSVRARMTPPVNGHWEATSKGGRFTRNHVGAHLLSFDSIPAPSDAGTAPPLPGGPTDSIAAALVRTTMNPLHLCTQCAQHCGQVHLDNRTKRDAKVNKWVHGWLQSGVNLGHPATFVQVRVRSLQLPGSSSRATVIHNSLWIELWICLQSAVDNTVDDCVHNPVRARQCSRYR